MNKKKYTIYLKNNNSRIVLTDSEIETEDEIIQNIQKLMNSTETSVFQTKTDLIFIKPSNIEAIHVTLDEINLEQESDSFLEEDLEDDSYKTQLEEVRKEILNDDEEIYNEIYENDEDITEEDGEELNEDLLKDFDNTFVEKVTKDEELPTTETDIEEKKEDLNNDTDSDT